MTVAALVADLRRRGVQLTPAGDQIRYRAPRGTLTEVDLAAIRTHRDEVLAELLRSDRAGADLGVDPILDVRQELGAVLLRSRRFGREIWMALTEPMAAEIRAEEAQRPEPRPVLLPEDVISLSQKPEAAVRAALDIAGVFPGSRVQ